MIGLVNAVYVTDVWHTGRYIRAPPLRTPVSVVSTRSCVYILRYVASEKFHTYFTCGSVHALTINKHALQD